MKNLKLSSIAAALLLLSAVSVRAAEIKFIANDSVGASSISTDELKHLFLLVNNSLADGSHAVPVLLKGGAAHEAFLKDYLGKTDSGLQTYYRSLVFTGKASMPKIVGSDAEVVAFVAKTKGAIGYISAAAAAPGAKTLEVK
jgi:ABC-type phosphate transport system substrate-binding protein